MNDTENRARTSMSASDLILVPGLWVGLRQEHVLNLTHSSIMATCGHGFLSHLLLDRCANMSKEAMRRRPLSH